MFSLISLMLLSHSIFATSTIIPSCDDEKNNDVASQPKSIFILAGQSNMVGCGGVHHKRWDEKPPQDYQPNPQIQRLNANLTWEEARDPLHVGIDIGKPCGVGPGMSFANELLKRDPSIGVIGLVPCAVGGTFLSQWAVGGNLYNQTLLRARTALQAGGGKIRGVLWYQGESDAGLNSTEAALYKEKWEKIFTQLRCDLESPSLPVVHVIIGSADPTATQLFEVRKSQLAINLPNVKSVDSWNLELKQDKVHLTTKAQVELGRRLADAFLQLKPPSYV